MGRRNKHCMSEQIKRKKSNGWGFNLYRDGKNRRIAGVCAGLARHFDIEPWIVRIIAFGALILFQGLAFFAYLAAWVLIAKRDSNQGYKFSVTMEYNEEKHSYQPKKMFKYSSSPSARMRTAKERLNRALRRVENMEGYVTSKQYDLDKAFDRMK